MAKVIISVMITGLLVMAAGCGSSDPKPGDPIVSVWVTPGSMTVDQGSTTTFKAVVTGANNSSVTWSVQEGAAGGTIAADGTYTAPAKSGVYHIVATSVANPNSSSYATVNVPVVTVTMGNTKVVVDQGATQQLSAMVNGTSVRTVTWSLVESGTGGSVSASGVLTAPTVPGMYHVVATSTWDTTQTATCTVIVEASSITVTPSIAGVSAGSKYPFTATVRGLLDKRVTWSVLEGSIGGSIDSDGVYTPSSTPGTFHIVATCVADSSVSATATTATVAKRFSAPIAMMTNRALAAATLLASGDVLVTGGSGGDWWFTTFNSAEIFDHVTGTFRNAIGSMAEGRDSHTATRLKDGKVLIAGGGMDWWGSTGTAELFDPATETFSAVGKMISMRSAHTATLLNDGKVLIAGGVDWNAFIMVAAAEIYDPATGTFTVTGSMVEPRWWHTATVLADGRVLFTGGTVRNTGYYDYDTRGRDSVEIYDPATGTFSLAGTMGGKHEEHAVAVLADGTLLITGGLSYTDAIDPATFTYQDDAHISAAPAWNVVPLTARMNTVRASHTSTLLNNGLVLLAGGRAPTADNSVELFDPATSTFLITESMAKPRYRHTATLLNDGRVLICGGGEMTAEIYDPR